MNVRPSGHARRSDIYALAWKINEFLVTEKKLLLPDDRRRAREVIRTTRRLESVSVLEIRSLIRSAANRVIDDYF